MYLTKEVFYFVNGVIKMPNFLLPNNSILTGNNIHLFRLSVMHSFIHWNYWWYVASTFRQIVVDHLHDWLFVTVMWLLCAADVCIEYPGTTDTQISAKVGTFLAQSVDRDGARKEWALKQQAVVRAAPISPGLEVTGDADDADDLTVDSSCETVWLLFSVLIIKHFCAVQLFRMTASNKF